MSFLARLFGSDPDSKIAKAKRLMAMNEFHEARWLLDDLEHEETKALQHEVMSGLVQINLNEGRALYSAGDRARAEEHLAMAREFGANSEQLRQARRQGREAMPAPKVKKTPVDDGPVGDDPIWSLPPDDPRLRYALMVETYPEQLRARLLGLGPDFAAAALMTDAGDPTGAMKALTPFVGRDDVARYERARAAIAANELPAAGSELIQFGASLGHQAIGSKHTAMMMVQVLSKIGRAEEALTHILTALDLAQLPHEQTMMKGAEASLLFMLGRDEEADTKATALLRNESRDMGLVKLLSQIRKRRGQRVNAMAMLEDGLNRCCSAPGKCGSQPLDVEAVRMLIVMYLEDNIEAGRVDELLADLEKHSKQPTWDDGYISALQARNTADPRLKDQVMNLSRGLQAQDPRLGVLKASFSAQMGLG
jgi:tetratricopeptide (TPR) repeat protein